MNGNVGDDRFIGLVAAQGIAKIIVRGSQGALKVDHLQYGRSGSAPALQPLLSTQKTVK